MIRCKLFIFLVIVIVLPLFSGCATPGYIPPPVIRPPFEVKEKKGVYHRVKEGETLYRIAQTYNVDLDEIVAINRIPNPARIEKDQLIFIPGVFETKETKVCLSDKTSPSGYIWPVKGEIISFFGQKVGRVTNKGIDIRAKEGTEIRASKTGVVSFCSEQLKGYGKIIIIDHGDGYQSVYAYNTENLVRPGQKVEQGQVIARVGKTGRAAEPTLHFEIRKGHIPQNPFHFLP